MSLVRKAGTADVSVVIRIVDSTDGTPETGVVFNTAGIDLQYRREGEASTAIVEATLAALTTAHTDGGFLHIGNGYYRLDLPDAACATGVTGVLIHGTVTGMVVIGQYIQLTAYDPFDTVRLGLTALPNAAAEAAGGLYTRGTGAGQINQPANGLIDVNVENWNTTAVPAEHTAGYPIVTIKDGTGTGEINTNAGAIALVDLVTTTSTATAVTTVNGLAANVITAASIATGAIDADAIAADAITAAKIADGAIDAATFAAGAITATVIADGAIDRATFAADTGLQTVRSNTAQAGGATSITLDASASATTDFYKHCLIYLTGGTGAGQFRLCTAYNGTTKVATVTPAWTTNPDVTSTFAVLPAGIVNVEALGANAQSMTDLKDFADDGYDPATNKVQGVVLVDTLTTYTGNTPQTGDSFARIGAAGAGLTAIDLPDQTMNITGNITGNLSGSVGSVTGAVGSVTGAVGSVTGNVGGNVTGSVGSLAVQAKADVNAEADTALSDVGVTLARMGALTDWIDGGRLDLLIDAVKAKTDLLPEAPAKNTAFTYVIKMVDATDGITPETGLTVTMTRSLDGAAFAAATGAVTEISTGHYKVAASAADMNGDVVAHRFTATGARDFTQVIQTTA